MFENYKIMNFYIYILNKENLITTNEFEQSVVWTK